MPICKGTLPGAPKTKGFRGPIRPRTIKKELATLRAIWNRYALPRKMVPVEFRSHFGLLWYGKERCKPPFQTWEQIERRISRGGLTKDQRADLWDCLFLDLEQTGEVPDHVRSQVGFPPWLYPMVVFAAHTGARRSEMIRSEVFDWGFDTSSVQIREKKRDKEKKFTYRPVSLSPLLGEVMQGWIGRHPGGLVTICDQPGQPITMKAADYWFGKVLAGSKWQVLRGWHLFRHSLASNLACEGIDQRIIDATLGHQTEEMRRRYRHLFPSQQRAVMASIFAKR